MGHKQCGGDQITINVAHELDGNSPSAPAMQYFCLYWTKQPVLVTDEGTVHIFLYVAVPVLDDALKHDPNHYMAMIYNTIKECIEFVVLEKICPYDISKLAEVNLAQM